MELEKILSEYQNKLNLGHWELELFIVDQAKIISIMNTKKDTYYGCCTYDYDNFSGEIYIEKDLEFNDKVITLKHELLHILFCELRLIKKIGKMDERLINTLVNAM